MSDDDKIKLTQKEAALGLTHRIVAIATECAEAGMPPAAVTNGIVAAAIGLSYKDDGLPATIQWLHNLANKLERTTDHPEGTA